MGDYLIVLLENDRKVKKLKGENRPIFIQKERAEMLAALKSVDLIVLLPMMENDRDYLNLIRKLAGYYCGYGERSLYEKKGWQAEEVGAELKIIPLTKTFSTSRLAKP